jgi:hypothetical protein
MSDVKTAPRGNSPAFPCVDKDKRMWTGMNLRDYFALESLNALIRNVPHDPKKEIEPDTLAMLSYAIANSMLDEREKFR